MVSAILFDFGGTLDSDGVHWLDRFWRIYEKNGLAHIPKDQIKEAFYWADRQAELDPAMRKAGLRPMMERHVRWQFEKLQLNDLNKQAAVTEGFVRPCERLLRRNRRVLEDLSVSGLKLGIVSNFYGNVETLCKEFGFLPFINVILDSAVIGLAKPDPKFFTLALEKLGLGAEQVAFVGDNYDRDMVPAKSVGMETFWLVGDQVRMPPHPAHVDHVLHSLEDLPSHLKPQNKVLR